MAELHDAARDRLVLGMALGNALARVELDGLASYQRLAELLRAPGADGNVAAEHLQWQRTRPWR